MADGTMGTTTINADGTYVDTDAKGKQAVWAVEGGSPNALSRIGWSKRMVNPGDKVKLEIHPLKDGRNGGFFNKIWLPDGRVVEQTHEGERGTESPAFNFALQNFDEFPAVGLEIHEDPRVATTSTASLRPGFVVTVEPGVYLPDIGGVRIEDTVVVTDTGCDILTASPKDISCLQLAQTN